MVEGISFIGGSTKPFNICFLLLLFNVHCIQFTLQDFEALSAPLAHVTIQNNCHGCRRDQSKSFKLCVFVLIVQLSSSWMLEALLLFLPQTQIYPSGNK